MATVSKTIPTSLTYRWTSSDPERSKSRSFMTSYQDIGLKVKGTWKTFPNGSRFRMATDLTKFTSEVSPDRPQNIRGISLLYLPPGMQGYSRAPMGGFTGDDIIANSSAAVKVTGQAIRSAIAAPVEPNGMRNEAVTKALLDLAASKAAIAEDLATFSQTLRLIKDPFGFLIKGIKQVKAEKKFQPFLYQSARDLLRKGPINKVAEEYLKYVYGWKPLMQDVHGLIEMAKKDSNGALLLHSKGVSNRQVGLPSWNYLNATHGHTTRAYNGQEQSVVRCNIWASPDASHPGLRSLNQLGLINPLSLMWELVSWSFVVDWVLPIGPVLNALTAPAGLTFVDGSIGVKATGSYDLDNWHSDFDSGYSLIEYQKAHSKWNYRGYRRSRLATFPLPGFWVDPDPFRLKADGSDRIFKALALATLTLR